LAGFKVLCDVISAVTEFMVRVLLLEELAGFVHVTSLHLKPSMRVLEIQEAAAAASAAAITQGFYKLSNHPCLSLALLCD
jgi:hypothetical protein